ncbi:type I restriction endonuclease subunit R [Aliarcobacter cryaerophilus]|uniref:Type I restriction enzyme endonuclease subunit n=2 Tax=unclassified Arcobacter TaxID=2593671 RepID=A0AA96I2D1_9BACT|nr:HsdR family type I site-specific deoxyribonuclease [Arcobacter sp. AZ-2023]WPD10140.1 HsdR family type I site-specific deoxyribonuclease [Arcobacter sp. DSM 115954]WNL14971.1 HsdR family type I site-specific deoxyribonuclease [Arcobacter sp. AZ-2023]WNL19146.1 HsdR family type I site-specific deoxyribonuclease [Arcobacter sp. AZ-2023]WNL21285.1 HsdR family type I site-specific deoxyribonuclease [Arcobacter sp. AZ-2023]
MSKFTEEKLELAFIELLENQGITYVFGKDIQRNQSEVLLEDDLKEYLKTRYKNENIRESEIAGIVRKLQNYPASDLYDSNKAIMKLISDGFILKREKADDKDIYIEFINYDDVNSNNFKIVNQLEIMGYEKRIPDGILYINGIPLVVFEFKSAIREEATIHDAFVQLTTRYRRDIPELFKYNALCVISDGVNNKSGSFFSPYEFFYSWRKITGDEVEVDGIPSMHSMIAGMFDKERLVDIIHNFIYMPDKSKKEEKIVCRYPQYYATKKLYENIKAHQKPQGDGKGGTYFGATGCGKSFTMLYLARMLMKSIHFSSPTIILITDRTDLDVQLSSQFSNAKGFIGDDGIVSVESRADLRQKLQGRESGGVFLTTIHKFTEDLEVLSQRTNIIVISDEAHRSQINLDQKIKVTQDGVKKSYGFAKYLHDSLPNATYVGFTGTPIDATLDVFGDVVDSYTMTESVRDEITVRIVYEGRAAKVLLDNSKLEEIEKYYEECANLGANEYQIEDSKKAITNMSTILGDMDRIKAIAKDFVEHYEKRVEEGASIKGKAIFVSSSRSIAYSLFKEIIALRPSWNESKVFDDEVELSDKDKKEILPLEKLKMIMTRSKDDEKELYEKLGTKDYRKTLDTQFKNEKSNFKIAIVVDMWLTGFDVPFLDTIYIDKPIQEHNLIQTISRVNRKYAGKEKGLVVDYIGIKTAMNKALKQFSKMDSQNFEDIEASIVVVRDQLDLLSKLFYKFDTTKYFNGTPTEQLATLNNASEFVQLTKELENRFMYIVKRLKSAYDICCGSEVFKEIEKDYIHFYLAIRSIVVKLTRGEAPDTASMNKKVAQMIEEAIKSEGVEEIFKLGSDDESKIDIFDEDYINKINKIKLPNTKIKLLQQLLAKALEEFKKTNKVKAVDFSKKFNALVEKYNERKENDVLVSSVLDDFTEDIIDIYYALQKEKESFVDLGIDFEEKAFYDILKSIAIKYDFSYPEDKLIALSKEVKIVVDDKSKYTDWNIREDIKAELKVDLIILLDKHGYPPITKDDVYKEIFEQAENFKKFR